jgi:hypothetical protein
VQDIRYYLCLALARKRDSRVLKEVQAIKGDEHNFILGYYYRLVGRHADAIERLNRIINAPYVGARAARELVQVYIQTEEYDKALELAQSNYEGNRGNQFHIQAYFHCLINSNMYQNSKETLERLINELYKIGSSQSIQMADIANAEYLNRCDNNYIAAMDKINDAILKYPDIIYPALAKFDMALKHKNFDAMKDAYNKINELSKKIAVSEVSLNKQRAYLEAAKGNTENALNIILPYLDRYPNETRQRIEAIIRDLACPRIR